jgi:hypothetical protein
VEKRVEVVERLRGAWRYVSSHELKGFGFKISLLGLTLPQYCKLRVNQQYLSLGADEVDQDKSSLED